MACELRRVNGEAAQRWSVIAECKSGWQVAPLAAMGL